MAQRPRVAFITDNAGLAGVICSLLERSGFDITSLGGNKDGSDSVHQESPSVILLDLALAGGSGIETYRQLKADAELGSIPVIALASMLLDVDALKELSAAEKDGYLFRPFNEDELLGSIDLVLGRY